MITIDELLTESTADDIFDGMLSNLETFGIPARSWRIGGTGRTILRIVATLYAGFTAMMVAIAKAGFLPTATGGWLTMLAKYVYGIDRIAATYASGKLTLSNSGGGIYSFGVGDYIAKASGSGKSYANVAPFTLNPTSTITIDIRALELGSASNAIPGAIDTNVSSVGSSVTPGNTTAVLGTDEEIDDVLRQRCLDSLGANSNRGPRTAYATAVSSAKLSDGSPTSVNRAKISPYSSTGQVTIVLASAAGTVTVDDINAVAASVEALARPDTDTVTVSSAVAITDTRSVTVWATKTSGIDAATIMNAVVRALTLFQQAYPVGGRYQSPSTQGYLFKLAIAEAAKLVTPGVTTDADAAALATIWMVEVSGSDLSMNPNEVAVLNYSGGVTVRITEPV